MLKCPDKNTVKTLTACLTPNPVPWVTLSSPLQQFYAEKIVCEQRSALLIIHLIRMDVCVRLMMCS